LAQLPVAVISDEVSEGAGAEQESLAVGVPKAGALGHSIVEEASVEVQVGEMVSTTLIVCDVVVLKPEVHASAAVQERTTL
jgi:hypothetical protein